MVKGALNLYLDRVRIKRLLTIGLFGALMTGVGDFLLGFGANEPMDGLAGMLMGNARNLSDGALIAGGWLGVIGILLEAFGFFGIYRLMADSAPKPARFYRFGILVYVWLAPIGCHMNVGVYNLAFKYLLKAGSPDAMAVANQMIVYFCLPIFFLLFIFWVPMLVIAFKTFGAGLTPYPRYAKWFNLVVGAIPAVLIGGVISAINPDSAWGGAISTLCLSTGNALTFSGLLATMPPEETFEAFRNKLARDSKQTH